MRINSNLTSDFLRCLQSHVILLLEHGLGARDWRVTIKIALSTTLHIQIDFKRSNCL